MWIIPRMKQKLKTAASWVLWPLLLTLCLAITGYGFNLGQPVLYFNIAYAFLAATLLALERIMPHEKLWNENDGQIFADIAHTLVSKGTVQSIVVFSAVIGLSTLVTPVSEPGYGIWPREWALPVQVVMGVLVSEFGLYWAHRIAHEWKPLWNFHAVHHSVTRLWIVNTGRFHFIDSLKSILPGMIILLALGAPMEVLTWLSAITAFIGMLTHCNVEMRFGPVSWLLNTPELHRWHHSKDLREGNKNYGENVMIWDHLFGSYFNESWRRPPQDIGIPDPMPASFVAQLAWPFQRLFRKQQQEAVE